MLWERVVVSLERGTQDNILYNIGSCSFMLSLSGRARCEIELDKISSRVTTTFSLFFRAPDHKKSVF